jgi:hypothetical protein
MLRTAINQMANVYSENVDGWVWFMMFNGTFNNISVI